VAGGVRSLVVVDLGAVRANVRRLREALGPRALYAVVKADGYGHGALDVARASLDAGAEALCVATVGEARALRAHLRDERIVVLGPLAPGEEREVDGLEIVVGTEDVWRRVRDRPGLAVHVKVETGMGRWGLEPEAAVAMGRALAASPGQGPRLAGLMSHLATADEPDPAFARAQVRAFAAVADAFPPCARHLANSAGTLRLPEARFDAGRCGIALYGISPSDDDPYAEGLTPVLSWTSEVAALRRLAPGQSSGYGRRLVAERELRIALVPVGYADGYPRTLSGAADALVRGRRRRVSATVSMDQLALTLEPGDEDVAVGDTVTLVGRDGHERVGLEELAGRAGTIGYELATRLTARPQRVAREVRG
jgi:alanine racemase